MQRPSHTPRPPKSWSCHGGVVYCVRQNDPLRSLGAFLKCVYQWRVEERDDWRALLDSMQEDRTVLQQQNARLEVRRRLITVVFFVFEVFAHF